MGILGRWKRWLYTLCFAALSVLDFVRNTQNGDVWGVAVNLTGLVMLVVIASAWPLKRLLTVGNGVWTLACIALAVYACVSILPTGMDVFHGMYVWTFVSAVANAWWIGIFLKDLVKNMGGEISGVQARQAGRRMDSADRADGLFPQPENMAPLVSGHVRDFLPDSLYGGGEPGPSRRAD